MRRSFPAPRKIVTDQLRSYPAATAGIPVLPNVKHVFVKAGARVNNRAENASEVCGDFATRSALRLASRASGRSASTSP